MTKIEPKRSSLGPLSPTDAEARSLDARVIRSVLAFVGQISIANQPKVFANARNELVSFANEHEERLWNEKLAADMGPVSHFQWIPEKIKQLVKQARLLEREFKWQPANYALLVEAAVTFRGFFLSNFSIAQDLKAKLARRFTCSRSRTGMPWKAHREWLDSKVLASIGIFERFRYGEFGIYRVVVPSLKSEGHCVAYAIAILSENRWGLADRIRICPFAADPEKGFHLSLDFRLRPSGEFERNAQYYCGPEHQNAHKQQNYRNRHKAERQARKKTKHPGTI